MVQDILEYWNKQRSYNKDFDPIKNEDDKKKMHKRAINCVLYRTEIAKEHADMETRKYNKIVKGLSDELMKKVFNARGKSVC